MTNESTETIVDPPAKKAPAKEAAKPARQGCGLLAIVLFVALLLVSLPLMLAAVVVGYLYLRPAPPLPPPHLVELPAEATANEAVGEANAPTFAPRRENEHPLDKALEVAYRELGHMRKNVNDYTATLLSIERIGGKLKPEQTMFVKIRSPKTEGEKVVTPFSVYLKFVGPKDKAGREVIYVAGQNDNMLIGHDTGFLNVTSIKLRPTGPFAMMGERYPITEIGMERLAEQLIERGEEERLLDPKTTHLEVTVDKQAEFEGRPCTRIFLRYPEKTPKVEFYSAEVFIDNNLHVPIYYAAYSWPEVAGGEPQLEEQYTYRDVKLNVGLTDEDFNPDNKEYKFP